MLEIWPLRNFCDRSTKEHTARQQRHTGGCAYHRIVKVNKEASTQTLPLS